MSSFTINRVVLVGRLTQDPELHSTPSGSSVCGLRIACNATRRDAEGEYHDKPNFFDVSIFDTMGEQVSRYTQKGNRVAIDGRLQWREWETAGQQKHQAVSVVADKVMFLDGPSERSGLDQSQDGEFSGGFGGEGGTQLVGVGAGAEDNDLAF
jgi:single-strand DNA-binding protein